MDDIKAPVTALTESSGSGETTLSNYTLSEQHGRRIAVIENVFATWAPTTALVVNAEEEAFGIRPRRRRSTFHPPDSLMRNWDREQHATPLGSALASPERPRPNPNLGHGPLDLGEDNVLVVTELACREPGYPTAETIIAVLGPRGQRHTVHKPVNAVTQDDVVRVLSESAHTPTHRAESGVRGLEHGQRADAPENSS